jgi:aryl-alcohol dehydrogenase-like predicted oxidoreductase
VPLFGTRKLGAFEENIRALSVQLTGDDMRELNGSKTTMPVEGARYPDEQMQRVGL